MRTGKSSRQSGFAQGRTSSKAKKSAGVDPVSRQREFKESNRELLKGVVSESLLDKIEEDSDNQIDRFAKEFRKLRKKTSSENDNFNADALNRLMLRAMLTMVLDVIPLAEKAYRQSRKENAAYALNALLNQGRELALDLKLSKDTAGQSEFIQSNILTPIFVSFTQILISETFALKSAIDTEVSSTKLGKSLKAKVDVMTKALGDYQTKMITKLGSDIDGYLSGTLRLDKKPSKKG